MMQRCFTDHSGYFIDSWGLGGRLGDASGDGADDQGEHEVAGQAFEGDAGFGQGRDGVDVAEAHGGHHGDGEVEGVEDEVMAREGVEGWRHAGDDVGNPLHGQVEHGEGCEHGDVDLYEVACVFPGYGSSGAEHVDDAMGEFIKVNNDHGHDEDDDGQSPGGKEERGDAEAGEEGDASDFKSLALVQGFGEEIAFFLAVAPIAEKLGQEDDGGSERSVQGGHDEVGEDAFIGDEDIDQRVGAFFDEVQKKGAYEDARDEVGEEKVGDAVVFLSRRGLRHAGRLLAFWLI